MNTITNIILAFVAGIVASIIAWWLVLAFFTPRLEISKLNRFPDTSEITPCGYRYRVKVRNRMRRYAIAGIVLNARLVIEGLDKENPRDLTSLAIPFGVATTFPVLEGLDVRERVEDSERVYTLHIHDLDTTAEANFPPETLLSIQKGTALVEDLLTLGTDAFIRFAVSVSHARSGYGRTYFTKFRLSDMCDGEFLPDSVDVRKS